MKKGVRGGGGLKEELRLRGEQGGSVHSANFHCFQMLLDFLVAAFLPAHSLLSPPVDGHRGEFIDPGQVRAGGVL